MSYKTPSDREEILRIARKIMEDRRAVFEALAISEKKDRENGNQG